MSFSKQSSVKRALRRDLVWMKDWTVKKLWWNIYRIEWDWKMGAMCWWHYYGIGVPECHTGVTWPLWYGGYLLGLPEAPGW